MVPLSSPMRSPPRGDHGEAGLCVPEIALKVSVTSTWLMLLMTLNPPRSQAQTSTQSPDPRTAPNLGCRTTVETSTQSPDPRTAPNLGCRTTVEVSTQSQGHPIARSLAVLTVVEVTLATRTGTTAATRPDPSRPQVVGATTPAMMGPETHTAADLLPAENISGRQILPRRNRKVHRSDSWGSCLH
ncbi:glycoprotein Xg isoform X5 [Halichoerus grypus]